MALGTAVAVPSLFSGPLACSRHSYRAEVVEEETPSLLKVASGPSGSASGGAPVSSALSGLDLAKLTVGDSFVTASVSETRTARLTVDPTLQRVADALMVLHRVPEAAVVLMDVATGKILVYASHVESGKARDLCVEATAPAASVFKMVTASALVEQANLGADERACYSGGEQRITPRDLVPDPKRDRWCTTLGGAMGRSINTVFARLATTHLRPAGLEGMAKSLGFGSALPFDVPVQPSAESFPEDTLGFARTAAGFWNTTLSPLHAAWLGATMARGGEPVRPLVVSDVVDGRGAVVWTAASSVAQKRAVKQATADAVTTMMESTVSEGTSYRAFHDPKGAPFLPGVSVAGKTGTLTDASSRRFYTWFTGFAPSHPVAVTDAVTHSEAGKAPRQVAIGVLIVNNPTWTIKANVLAREVLRAYFASQGVPSVTTPQLRVTSVPVPVAEAGMNAEVQPSTTPPTKHRRQRGS